MEPVSRVLNYGYIEEIWKRYEGRKTILLTMLMLCMTHLEGHFPKIFRMENFEMKFSFAMTSNCSHVTHVPACFANIR